MKLVYFLLIGEYVSISCHCPQKRWFNLKFDCETQFAAMASVALQHSIIEETKERMASQHNGNSTVRSPTCSCRTLYVYIYIINCSFMRGIHQSPMDSPPKGPAIPTAFSCYDAIPDNKDHEDNMGPTWILSAPGGPHISPMNLAIRDHAAPPRRSNVLLRSGNAEPAMTTSPICKTPQHVPPI